MVCFCRCCFLLAYHSSSFCKDTLHALLPRWVRVVVNLGLAAKSFSGAKRVVATDGDVEVIRLLKENCKGFENVVVKHFPWGGTIEEADLDVVMAADVVFDESNHPALLESLSSAPRLVLVVRKRHKKVEKRFFAELGKRLALVRKIKASTLQLQLPVNATDIRVFEYARK